MIATGVLEVSYRDNKLLIVSKAVLIASGRTWTGICSELQLP